jgi:Tfp pilus assembly PilM family ATPase
MKILNPKPKSITAIELDNSSIKIAQSQLILSRTKLTRLFFAKIDDIQNRQTKDQVKNILEQNKIELNTCLLSLPRHNVTTRYLKLPTILEEELSNMVKLQIPKLLPYAPGEIVYSYKKIAQDSENYSYCIVILAQLNLVRVHYAFLESLGIIPAMVILSSEGSTRWLKAIKKEQIKQETVALVDVDSQNADVMIISSGELIFTRSIARQEYESVGALSWHDKLQEEINLSLQTATKEIGNKTIGRLFLSGSSQAIKDADKALADKFSFPVEVLSTINEDIAESSLALNSVLTVNNASFTSVVGAVINKESFSIDLMPADIKIKAEAQRIEAERLKLVFLILIIFMLLSGIFLKNMYDKSKSIKALDQRIKILLPKASMREQVSLRLETMRNQLKPSSFMSDLLKEVYTIIPDEIYLNSLSIQKDKLLILKGQANDLGNVFNLAQVLGKSVYFENVRVRYATKRRIRDIDITDFQIDCPLRDVGAKW